MVIGRAGHPERVEEEEEAGGPPGPEMGSGGGSAPHPSSGRVGKERGEEEESPPVTQPREGLLASLSGF